MLLTLLVLAIIAVLAFYIVREMKLAEPINRIVLIIVGVILLVALLSMVGFGPEQLRKWP